MLKTRVLTAVVLMPLLLAAVLWLPAVALVAVFAVIALMAAWEWAGLAGASGAGSRWAYVGVCAAAMALLYGWGGGLAAAALLWVALVWWLVAAVWLARAAVKGLRGRFSLGVGGRGLVIGLVGLVVLLPAWCAVSMLAADGGQVFGPWPVPQDARQEGMARGGLLALFAIVWAADIGAYFIGRAYGSTRLAPALSPGKSLQGAYGGLAAAAVVAAAAAGLLGYSGLALALWVGLGVVCAVFSMVGDLHVSVFKRLAGVKDSGALLPGHGGVLDRIDSLTAAAPVYVLGLGGFARIA